MSENDEQDFILVNVTESATSRGGRVKSLEVGIVAKNVNLFMAQIEGILEQTPENVGKFKFTEFTISAEISAKGALVIMGTGVETTGSGGLSFKFERK
ncbi:MAG: hypothetical protein GY805_26020 [Chloroflexi bacterium]|nr:hypothetical protein [Chloroflexota bacterium]